MNRTSQWQFHAYMAEMILLSATFLNGCTSTSSTVMQRMDSSELVGNSNGLQTALHANKPFKGIPTTVTIPTHVDIRIDETLYFEKATMKPVVLSTRHLSAHPTIVYSDKIIAVDPKRPAAGTLDYNLAFPTATGDYTKDQRFNKIIYNVEDQTIQTITEILKNVVPSLGLGAAKPKELGASGGAPDDSLMSLTRTVAWKRFDLSASDMEPCIAEFVSIHLNNCHGCNGSQCIQQQHPSFNHEPIDLINHATSYPTSNAQ